MPKRASTSPTRRVSVDQSIKRLREQVAHLSPFLTNNSPSAGLEQFDQATERLISDLFGETSEKLESYEMAQLGESSSFVNVLEEAQEGGVRDREHEGLHLRRRMLESCIAELEARRATEAKKSSTGSELVIGPRIEDYMMSEIRSVEATATLKEAGRLMQEWKVGSLLVATADEYVGVITDTDLAREVVAKGLDPSKTLVKAAMRKPLITIESDQPILEAVRLMTGKATRHLVVTDQGEIIGVISVSNILQYYSGVL